MEIRVTHDLGRERAAQRIRAAAERLEIAPASAERESAYGGVLVKETPMGAVTASWEAGESDVCVRVEKKPAFLPGGTVKRVLEEGLREALGA